MPPSHKKQTRKGNAELSQARHFFISEYTLLFGAKKIPELAKSMVEAIKHLRGAFKDLDNPEDKKKK